MRTDEYYLMKHKFLSTYLNRRAEAERKGLHAKDEPKAVHSLEEQYSSVLKVSGDSATVNVTGPLSEEGPDFWDIYLGYGGTSYANIRRAVMEASSVSGPIYLNINSPGGTISGLDETYRAIREVAKNKEVIAINSGLVASAAMWLAAGSSKLVARTETAMTGSIGVAVATMDATAYYADMGIEIIELTNDESPDKRPNLATEAGKGVVTEELNQIYSVFEKRVIDFGVSKKNIRSLKGAVTIADKAIDLGLMHGFLDGDTPTSSVSKDSGDTKENESNKDNVTTTKEVPKMDLAKLKAEHPELYNKIIESACKEERERCLTFVGSIKLLPQCTSIYEDAIKAGKSINDASVHAAVTASTLAKAKVEEASDENLENVVATKPIVKEAGKDDSLMSAKDVESLTAELKNMGV